MNFGFRRCRTPNVQRLAQVPTARRTVPALAGELQTSSHDTTRMRVHPRVVGGVSRYLTHPRPVVRKIVARGVRSVYSDYKEQRPQRFRAEGVRFRVTPNCFVESLSSVTPVSRLRKPCGGRHAHSKDSRSGDSTGLTPGCRTTAHQPRVARDAFSLSDQSHTATGPRLRRDAAPIWGSGCGRDELRRPDGGALSKLNVLLGDGL